MARAWAALLLLVLPPWLGCTTAHPVVTAKTAEQPVDPAVSRVIGVVARGSSVVGGDAAVDAPADAPAHTPAAQACPAVMFTDHKPGNHGLHGFEDAGGLHGFKDGAGRIVIGARYRFAYEFSKEGIAAAIDLAGRPVFIDTTGAVKAEAYRFDNGPDYFSSGRARVVANGKVGFIDERGVLVVTPRWDGATAFCGKVALVCNGCTRGTGDDADVLSGGVWGAIDPKGREIVPLVHTTYESARRAAGS